MTEYKTRTKRIRKEQKKLCRAVNTLATMVDSIATSMKSELQRGETFDIKQLKELTSAAKELSTLIGALDESKDTTANTISVSFEGGDEEWAK